MSLSHHRSLLVLAAVAILSLIVTLAAPLARARQLPPFELDKLLATSGLMVHVKGAGGTKVEVLEVLRGKLDEKMISVPALKYGAVPETLAAQPNAEMVLFLHGGLRPGHSNQDLQRPNVVLFDVSGKQVSFLTTNFGGSWVFEPQPGEGNRAQFLKSLRTKKMQAEAESRAHARAQAIAELSSLPLTPRQRKEYDAINKLAGLTLPGDSDGIDALIKRRGGDIINALREINDADAPAKLLKAWGTEVADHNGAAEYVANELGPAAVDVLLQVDLTHSGNDFFNGTMSALLKLLTRRDVAAKDKDRIVARIISTLDSDTCSSFLCWNAFQIGDRRILAGIKKLAAQYPNYSDYQKGVAGAEARIYRIEHGIESLSLDDLKKLAADPQSVRGLTREEVRKKWGEPDVTYTDEDQYYPANLPAVGVDYKDGRVDSISLDDD